MQKPKQLLLDSIFYKNQSKSFGGLLLKGKRKTARPIALKKQMHIVIKSQKAKGRLSFLLHRHFLDKELQRLSQKWHIRVRNRVWVTNHIHIILSSATRQGFKNFLKEFGATIVRILSQRTKQRLDNFFEFRPFSRVIEYGRDLKSCIEYLIQNELENFGLRKYKKQKRRGAIGVLLE